MSQFRFTRPDNFPPIVKNLIVINVLVWVAQIILDPRLYAQSGFTLTDRLALWPVSSDLFKPYQIATHMFTHAAYQGGRVVLFHILFNMFGLWMFGRILETRWGPKRFLLFYLICGVGAAAVHLVIQYFTGSFEQVVGASGAIMGIFAAFGYLFPNTELYFLFIPFPIKAKWLVIGLAAWDIFGGISGGDNVAHFAHLGGALTGFILVLIWNKTDRRRFY
jgi:membrane associated rhomboid family serine protease